MIKSKKLLLSQREGHPMTLKKKNESGFTIVELLIVIVIIAILAAITIVAYSGIQDLAKQSAAQSAVSQASQKLQTYFITHTDTYPPDLATAGITNSGDTTFQYSYNNSANPKTYCITATTDTVSYYQNNSTQTSPTTGGCPGHSANGISAITNMSVNPSFETSLNGVSIYAVNLSRPTNGGDSGTAYLRATRNNTSGTWGPWWDAAPTGVQAGQTYTVSIRTRSNVSVSRDLRIEWMSVGLTSIISSATLTTATPGTNWTTMSGTATAPSGAAGIRLAFYAGGTGTTSDYVDVDSVMITQSSSAVPYADGTTDNWVWNGTAHNSTSTGLPL